MSTSQLFDTCFSKFLALIRIPPLRGWNDVLDDVLAWLLADTSSSWDILFLLPLYFYLPALINTCHSPGIKCKNQGLKNVWSMHKTPRHFYCILFRKASLESSQYPGNLERIHASLKRTEKSHSKRNNPLEPLVV